MSKKPFSRFASEVSAIDDVLLVSASAGTGKTWLLTHLAARWLVEEGGDPERLLMVTFSRAAAAELKSRLRSKLTEFRNVLEANSASESTFNDEWALELSRRASGREREWIANCEHALSRLDEVHARTIHSFAAAVTQLGEASVADSTDIARRAAREALVTRALGGDESLATLLAQLEKPDQRSSAGSTLAGRVARAVSQRSAGGGVDSPLVHLERVDGDTEQGELLDDTQRRYDSLVALDELTTYDSLIASIDETLRTSGDALVRQMRSQFSLVLVDEFQDTDALQWSVIERLFRYGADKVPMILVGDAKQAIYGFRGGDVSVFQRVRRELTERGLADSSILELDVNFRSSGDLITALNELFGEAAKSVESPWTFSEPDSPSPIAYSPVSPSPRRLDQPGALVVRVPDSDIVSDVVAVTAEIIDQGVTPGAIAVLCRGNRMVRRLRRAFERAQIPVVTPSSSSVFDSEAAYQLATLMWILTDPRSARRSALITATWFGALGVDAVVELADDLAHKGLAGAARQILSREVLAELLAEPGGDRHWTDLEHLIDVLSTKHRFGADAEAIRRDIERSAVSAESSIDESDSAQRRIESDEDAVRIMSIHKSKGLEFPVVLVPEFGTPMRGNRLASWTDDDGRHIRVDSIGANVDTPPQVREAEVAEARRLVYVALTRAMGAVIAWRQLSRRNGTSEFDTLSDPIVDRRGGAIRVISAPDPVTLPPGVDANASAPFVLRTADVLEAPALDISRRRWSYTVLAGHSSAPVANAGYEAGSDEAYDGGAYGEDQLANPVAEPDDTFGPARGLALGRAVHKVFECSVGNFSSVNRATLRATLDSCFTDEGLAVPDERVLERFALLLSRPLGGLFDFKSLDDFVGARATSSEMRFTMPLRASSAEAGGLIASICDEVVSRDPEGPHRRFFADLARAPGSDRTLEGYLHGSIDLVARVNDHDCSRYVIVDYKTNSLSTQSSYSPGDLCVEMAHSSYPLQALIYSVALHRHLRSRIADYDPERHLGGVLYYYVRGARGDAPADSGLASWTVPARLVESVSDLLAGTRGRTS